MLGKPLRAIEEQADIDDDFSDSHANPSKNNSLFDNQGVNMLLRMGATSEIKTVTDRNHSQKRRQLRKSTEQGKKARQHRRINEQNQRIKSALMEQEQKLLQQRNRLGTSDYEVKLKALASTSDVNARSQTLQSLQQDLEELKKHHEAEKKLLQDKLRFAETERNQFRERLAEMELEKARAEAKLKNNGTISATVNILN